jgi:phage terminase large subunit-like protein
VKSIDITSLTPEELREVRFAANKALAERSLYHFVKQAWTHIDPNPYQDNWHISCISEHLNAVFNRQIRNLIINCPPRHTKSRLTSVCFPAWCWVKRPQERFLCVSYSEQLSTRDAMAARELISSSWYQERWGKTVQLASFPDRMDWYANTQKGYRISTTVGGKGLGEGGDTLIIDDPLKASDRNSPAALAYVIDWWGQTMVTRSIDPRTLCKIISMQRLSENDLTGYLVANELGYDHLVIPAWHEKDRIVYDPVLLGKIQNKETGARRKDTIIPTSLQMRRPELRDPRTEEGQLLWPERFSPTVMEALKRELLDGVPGQLQQRPAPKEGAIFKKDLFLYARMERLAQGKCFILKTRHEDEKIVRVRDCRFFQTIDTAMKTKKSNDFTAVGTFAMTPNFDLIIFHMAAFRIPIPYQMSFVKKSRIGPCAWVPQTSTILREGWWPKRLAGQWVEDKVSGTSLISSALSRGLVLHPLNPGKKDKVERAGSLAGMYELGAVYHMAGASWLSQYEDQVLTFPSGSHDDVVDCASYGALLSINSQIIRNGIRGLEKVGEEYAPQPPKPEDRDFGMRKPYALAKDETLDDVPESPIAVRLSQVDELLLSYDSNSQVPAQEIRNPGGTGDIPKQRHGTAHKIDADPKLVERMRRIF